MPIHRLYVCQTCVRDGGVGADGRSRGQRLGDTLDQALRNLALDAELHLIRVPCLNGCPSPCNVALRCSGKYALRFSRLMPEDAAAVLAFTAAYVHSHAGQVPESEWPVALRGKRTVNTPPPHLMFQSPRTIADCDPD